MACLNAGFLSFGRALSHNRKNYLALDLGKVRRYYEMLFDLDAALITPVVTRSFRRLVGSLPRASLTTAVDHLFVLIILECPLLLRPEEHLSVLEGIVGLLATLVHRDPSETILKPLFDVYASHEATFCQRAIQVLQGYLSYLLSGQAAPTEPVFLCCLTLNWLFQHNRKAELVGNALFYNDNVGATESAIERMVVWLLAPTQQFSFVNFPFLISLPVKEKVLRITSRQYMLRQIVMTDVQTPVLILKVSRTNLLEDTLANFAKVKNPQLWTCPLRVVFEGEEGVDEGGLVKEFFQLLMPKIYARACVPMDADGHRWHWFAAPTEERLQLFSALGLLFGLALYNSVLIEPLFPSALYKMLIIDPSQMNELNLDDLASCTPDVASNLQKLLEHEGRNEQDVYGLTFEMTYKDLDGKMETVPLKPGGADIPVTSLNKKEYVQLYIQHYLYERCGASFDTFKAGFLTILQKTPALAMLRPEELERLLCGEPEYDLMDLKQHVRYVNYTADDQVIKWFWETIESLPSSKRRKFLMYLTGSARVPVRGATDIRMVIQKTADDTRLPVTHTCFNVLDLPAYADKATLESKLLTAIDETEGFTLV
eukprot:TRINITY_DN10688_c0_g2_i2.p1 TRINITY_DN10688_c0_g2~~TRINITY_DN10688_c0_g2_i2.p1  ORF type:complete len:623 (+),score=131.76 TRINITY_DN10688_c0_g2_i2:77-1870(+)